MHTYCQPMLDPAFGAISPSAPPYGRTHPSARTTDRKLREALGPYLDLGKLRRLAAHQDDLWQALRGSGDPPPEVVALLDTLAVLLRPTERTQIKGPADVAALLMLEMGRLDQEQLRVVILNTRNRILKIHTVYQGSLNASLVRVGEVFKEALRLNAAALLLVHNHPSGEPCASPEDVLLTRQVVEAGKLLDCEAIDHLIIGQGRWLSMRQHGLGFEKM
jgi:DNA repair protein RadC